MGGTGGPRRPPRGAGVGAHATLLAMPSELAAVRTQYLEAQLAGNQRGALRILHEALEQGHAVAHLQRDVIQAAQLEVGRLWQENRISVAHEHMATAISQVALVHLAEHVQPAAARGRTLVIACVEGELHDLPARLVADYLECAGFDIRFLGANVPSESLASVVAFERADLLALSITMSFNADGLRSAVGSVRARCPSLPILVGGNALAWLPELAAQLGVTMVSGTPEEIVVAVERALAPEVAA